MGIIGVIKGDVRSLDCGSQNICLAGDKWGCAGVAKDCKAYEDIKGFPNNTANPDFDRKSTQHYI